MITAIQELIERLDKTEKQLDKENNLIMSSALYAAKNMALEYLEKEKEQIIKAHENGQAEFDSLHYRDKNVRLSNNYYKQTYNQNES
jgi:prefoldin subunit 5